MTYYMGHNLPAAYDCLDDDAQIVGAGHNYIGNTYKGHNYIGHNFIDVQTQLHGTMTI